MVGIFNEKLAGCQRISLDRYLYMKLANHSLQPTKLVCLI